MAEQTVREQMAAALTRAASSYHRIWCPETTPFADCKYPTCVDGRAALDRHRAEPEEPCVCNDHDCPTWEAGFLVGSEAQRERVG